VDHRPRGLGVTEPRDPFEDLPELHGNLTGREAEIDALTRNWSADRKAALLTWLTARTNREALRDRYTHPAHLAQGVDKDYRMTPALELISRSVERVLREPGRNLLVTMPPQEGKSKLCAVWTPLRALQLDPDTRIVVATHTDSLAEDHSNEARDWIKQFGSGVTDPLTGQPVPDRLGLSLSRDRSASWRIVGGRGGMVAVGLGSSLTGKPADLLIIDDPYKDMREADSPAHRRKVDEWYRSVALTRLAPGGSVILIHTRWHPEDLAGTVMAEERELPPEERTWRHINIPAVAEEGIPDALGREPGETMVSARGRTPEQFAARRRQVGERVWFALYEGVPAPPSGGLFARSWFDAGRIGDLPPRPVSTIVAVDPSESGEGDEAGIIAARLDIGGEVTFTDDLSAPMTSDRWAREAVELALTVGARELAVEGYTSATTYLNVVKAAWRDVRREALEASVAGQDLTPVQAVARQHAQMPFRLHSWRMPADAVGRSVGLRYAVETGKARVYAHALAVAEEQAVTWQSGQHQPDRVAAMVIAYERLKLLAGQTMTTGDPRQAGQTRKPPPDWLRKRLGG
jgi:hypothetical protein